MKDSVEEEDTEEETNSNENLERSRRESDENQNNTTEKPFTKREADYEESINQNTIDDSSIQDESQEVEESQSRNESRYKRDYERELKSNADMEGLEENKLENKENSKDLREVVENVETEDLDSSKSNLKFDQKMESDKNLESEKELAPLQNEKLESDGRLNKESKGSGMTANLDLEVKEDESEDDYEKRVSEQIQQRIDAIKEELKREIEEKQKIEEIEENNSKFDDLENEEEKEESQNSKSSDQQLIFKRSLKKQNSKPVRTKRRIIRRRKRSISRNLQNLKENEKMDLGSKKVQFRHESIRKRSAPEYKIDIRENSDQKLNSQNLNNNNLNALGKKSHKEEIIVKRNTTLNGNIDGTRATIPTSEQVQVKLMKEVPNDLLVLDSKLGFDLTSLKDKNIRLKRSNSKELKGVNRRQRDKLISGHLGYIKYRPQNIDDDTDDEGNEFEDDGFDDQTSNLNEDKSNSRSSNPKHERDEDQLIEQKNFLFDNRDYLKSRKQAQLKTVRDLKRKRHQRKRKRRKASQNL